MPQLKQSIKSRLVNFKVSEDEYQSIKAKADQYADGNVSLWIRYAAIELEPKAEDFEE